MPVNIPKSKMIAYLSLILVSSSVTYLFYMNAFYHTGNRYDAVCGVVYTEMEKPYNVEIESSENVTDLRIGKDLVFQNCTACHSLGNRKLLGPGLQDLSKRIPSEEWLYQFIEQPELMQQQKDVYWESIKQNKTDSAYHHIRFIGLEEDYSCLIDFLMLL